MALYAIPDTPYVLKPIHKCVRAALGLSAQLIGSIQLDVKRQISSICNFVQDIAWTFFCRWVTRSVIHLSKKWEKKLTLIVSFSQHSPFFEGQSNNSDWNLTGVIRHLGSLLGSLWQRCIFLHQPDKHRPMMNHMADDAHLKSNKAPIYAKKGPETASAKFLKVLFSWATEPEDCFCVPTPLGSTHEAHFIRVLGRTFQCHFRQSNQSDVNLTITYFRTAFYLGSGASDINAWKIAIWRFSLTFYYIFPEVINSVNFKYRAVKRSGPRQSCINPNYLHGFIPKQTWKTILSA